MCRRASRISNQSVFIETGSSILSNRMMASIDSSMRGRCVAGSMPSMYASEVSAPGPQPSMARPRVI